MVNDERIPIVLTIDIEPDARFVYQHAAPAWTGFEKLYRHLAQLRRKVERRERAPLRFSWFVRMDAQVEEAYGDAGWAAARYAAEIAAAAAAQDVFGLHVHAFRWDAARANWIVDHGNRDWVEHCVRISADAFRRAFHRDCLSYRMGDRYLDESILALMEALGGRADLTVEPGYPSAPAVFLEEPHTGFLPDVRDAPTRPYHPSPANFRRVDSGGTRALWIVPLSTWRTPRPLAIARMAYAMKLRLRKRPVPTLLTGSPRMTCGLSLPSWVFRRMVDDLLAEPVPYLASIDRSHVGNEPEKLRRIESNLRYLLAHPLAARFAFVAPEEAAEMLGT